jgi:hypothetical protein
LMWMWTHTWYDCLHLLLHLLLLLIPL